MITTPNFDSLKEFLTQDVGPQYIADLIDRHLFDYINYVVADINYCGNSTTAESIYYLKELRDRIRQCSVPPEE